MSDTECEGESADAVGVLRRELENLRWENRRLREELKLQKDQKALIMTDAEAQEEKVTNILLRKLNALKLERDTLALKVEQEEDYLTNTLLRKYNRVLKEKVELENQLEQEEEYIFNKLQKRLDKVVAEKCLQEYELEEEKARREGRGGSHALIRYLEAKYEKLQVQNLFHAHWVLSGILYRRAHHRRGKWVDMGPSDDMRSVKDHKGFCFSLPNIPLKNTPFLSQSKDEVVLKEGWMYFKFGFLGDRARVVPSSFFVLLGDGSLVAYDKWSYATRNNIPVFQLDVNRLLSLTLDRDGGGIYLELRDQSIWLRPLDGEFEIWLDWFSLFNKNPRTDDTGGY